MTERALQSAVFDFLRVALPRDAVAFSVPNGDGRVTTMPGALAGVPDICIIHNQRAIFIELKAPKGRVEPHQRDVHMRLAAAGAVVAVCRSLIEVEEFLSMVVPLKGRITA